MSQHDRDLLDLMESNIAMSIRVVLPNIGTDENWPARWERHMAQSLLDLLNLHGIETP